MTRLRRGAAVPALKVRWRGYDREEVEDYLGESRLRESRGPLDVSTGNGQATEQAQATPRENERLIGLRRDVAHCLLEISTAAGRDGRALLADDPPGEGGGPVDVEAGLRALSPTGDVDQTEPGELLQAARREVERLIGLRRDVANCLLEIGTTAGRDGRALLAADTQADHDDEPIDGQKAALMADDPDQSLGDPPTALQRLQGMLQKDVPAADSG